jgi:hypothetical protein
MPAMSVLSVRNVLPVVTSVVATLFLATAVPHDLVSEPVASASLARAEVQRCVADGRDSDECLDEADGKALIERAEWLARGDDVSRRASR